MRLYAYTMMIQFFLRPRCSLLPFITLQIAHLKATLHLLHAILLSHNTTLVVRSSQRI